MNFRSVGSYLTAELRVLLTWQNRFKWLAGGRPISGLPGGPTKSVRPEWGWHVQASPRSIWCVRLKARFQIRTGVFFCRNVETLHARRYGGRAQRATTPPELNSSLRAGLVFPRISSSRRAGI